MAIYAKWNGSSGYSRQSDKKGFLRTEEGLGISGGALNYESHYYLRVHITEPTIGVGELKGVPVWGFVDAIPEVPYEPEIIDPPTPEVPGSPRVPAYLTLTWTVRAKTQNELDEEAANNVLDTQLYFVLKWLFDEGVITQTNIDNAPQTLKDAYAARTRLNP